MSKKDTNIDAYSKALLDKKTEYNDELKKPKEEKEMSDAERKQAEKTLSSALDMLRRERGQKTIAEEERFYQEHKDDLKDTDEDFTTSSLEKGQSNEALDLVHAMLQDMSNDEEDEDEDVAPVAKEERPKKPKKKKEKSEKKEKVEKKEKKPKEKKSKKPMKTTTKIVLAVIFAGLVALGGYSYKVLIYNPQNIVSESQQKTYDKLVSYADEYGDNMMSDAEKLELLDLDADYKKLLDKQKISINEYFKEQTGKTYKQLLKKMENLKETKEEVKLPGYQKIMDLLNNWDTKSDTEKMAVVDMQSTYSSLSKDLKDEVNTLSTSKTGKEFMDLCKEQEELKTAAEEKAKEEEEKQKEENKSKVQEYQNSLASAQNEYNVYSQYAKSLEDDLAYAQQVGEDTTDIQAQIITNNQMLASLQQQITYYEQMISALQS